MSPTQHTKRRPWSLGIYDNNYEGGQKLLLEAFPEELNFNQALNEVGTFRAKLKFSRRAPTSVLSSLLPYVQDWRVQRVDQPSVQFGGIIEEITYNFRDRSCEIAGRDYTSALERPWYFSPYDPVGNWYPPDPTIFPRRIDLIISDLITNTFSITGSIPITYTSTLVGTPPSILYAIGLADTETLLSKIQTISQNVNGFDFMVDYAKVFHLYYPSKGSSSSVFILEEGRNCTYDSVRISQGGVTRTVVIGNLPDNRSGYVAGPGPMINGTGPRLKEMIIDMGDVDDNTQISGYATAEAARQYAPMREMDITYLPADDNENFWQSVTIGDKITVIGSEDLNEPTSDKRLVSMDVTQESDGEETIKLGLDEPSLSL